MIPQYAESLVQEMERIYNKMQEELWNNGETPLYHRMKVVVLTFDKRLEWYFEANKIQKEEKWMSIKQDPLDDFEE